MCPAKKTLPEDRPAEAQGLGTTPTAGEPTQKADDTLARLARGLGHPLRVAILRQLLREGQCVCGQIVDSMPRAQSTVSQHLKILKESGLVTGEIDGPRVCYCADRNELERMRQLLASL